MLDTKISADINQGRFATLEEIYEETQPVDYVKGIGTAAGVTVFTDGKTARVNDDDGFYMVVGGTGSKKTRGVVAPSIVNNAIAGNSMIITDIKGDLYKLTSRLLRKSGYRVVVLNFNNPDEGDAYNPIIPIYRDYKKYGETDRANRELNNFSEMIFASMKSEKDPFWHTTSGMYFTGLELALFDNFEEKDATIVNALNLHIQGDKQAGGSSYIKEFFSDMENTEAWKMMVSTVNAPNETRSSIHSVFVAALNRLVGQNKALIKMLSHSTFEVQDLIGEKVAVFLIANEESLSVHAGLITALIQQWYTMLVNIADQTNGLLKRKVTFVLDEFGNLPALKDFEITISLARARGISFMIAIQSFAQLELRYGKDVARTIIGNTSNWIYLFSPDPELLKYISELTGVVTDEAGRTRNLVSVNQLRHLKKRTEEGLTECLMILGRLNPIFCYLPDILDYYGIEPIDCLDIPVRQDVEVDDIDFCSMVENKKKAKLRKMMEDIEENNKKEREEEKAKIETIKKKDPLQLSGVINNVIGELIGGRL
ncbi:MAG: type IV secretory system conjugative DNA transfer family protein [Lachnospiraceae bacterium]